MSSETSYDDVPYPNLSFAQSHPDRLATIGTLLGLKPAPVDGCRVLELGCAAGGNLIPMAYALPGSEFVGLDYAPGQIATGQATVVRLGLNNIRLLQRDIVAGAADLGEFDYIIAHGVYSWVPPAVRDALLSICRQNLAAHGLAYISYNTYPGWHMLGAVREMMLYHTRHETRPAARIAAAREFMTFLADAVPLETDLYGSFLAAYRQLLTVRRDSSLARHDALLYHDELEAVNDPVYFHQFAEHAAQYGLRYVAEAEFAQVLPTGLSPAVAQTLMKMAGDVLEMEQYLDFVRNRTFRQTILAHRAQPLQRRLQPTPTCLNAFLAATRAVPAGLADERGVVTFKAPDGTSLATDHAVSIAALRHLANLSPQALPFAELLAVGRRAVLGEDEARAPGREEDALVLAANLLRGFTYSMNLVTLRTYQPPFVLLAGTRPRASSLARYQVAQGETSVINLLHERVEVGLFTGLVLSLLDGQRTQAELLALLQQLVAEGHLSLAGAATGPAQIAAALAEELQESLHWLGQAALLWA